MPEIISIQAGWILDSRSNPTVECRVVLNSQGKKAEGIASVPSGASTGTYEAHELRDNGEAFGGKGVDTAVHNILEEISAKVLDKSFRDASEVDKFLLGLDGTPNKSRLGANAILAVSMATHRAFAELQNLELWQYLRRLYFSDRPMTEKFPRLMCNVINGGAHADSGLAIQEFMVVPNSGNVEDDVRMASEIYGVLKKNLKNLGHTTALGDEGGFAPHIQTTSEVLELLDKSIKDAGYNNLSCDFAMDAAASEFYDKQKNVYTVDDKEFTQTGLTDFYLDLKEKFNVLSIEDGFAEDDVLGWQLMTEKMGAKTHLIGDDLFVTNPQRFREVGLANKIANGILIKLNQIGSVYETAEAINLARENGYISAVSHRSGETDDSFIADLAVAAQSEFIKLGAPARGERVAKFNRLLAIKRQWR